MTKVTMMGNPIEVKGHFPQKGEKVENVHFTNKDLADVSLGDFSGKRKVLNIFPSIDTGVCATSVRVFNQRAATLFQQISLLHKHAFAVLKELKMYKHYQPSAINPYMIR